MKAITIEDLNKTFDTAEAVEIYDKVAALGGFGVFNEAFRPPLDVSTLSESKQARVAELIGKPGESKPGETVESLAKLSREKLVDRAKAAGLDGNKYTDKTELAKAILEQEAK